MSIAGYHCETRRPSVYPLSKDSHVLFHLVMVFFSIVDHPKDVGMVDEDLTAEEDQAPIVENDFLENGEEAEEDEELTRANNSADEKPQFLRVLALPGVLPYSISFFALKLVNYSFFFWLPYFLHNKYHWSDETGTFRIRFNRSLGSYSRNIEYITV